MVENGLGLGMFIDLFFLGCSSFPVARWNVGNRWKIILPRIHTVDSSEILTS